MKTVIIYRTYANSVEIDDELFSAMGGDTLGQCSFPNSYKLIAHLDKTGGWPNILDAEEMTDDFEVWPSMVDLIIRED